MSRLKGVPRPIDHRKSRQCSIGKWLAGLDPAEVAQLEEWFADPDVPLTQIHRVGRELLDLTVGYEAIGHHARCRCACPEGSPLQPGS